MRDEKYFECAEDFFFPIGSMENAWIIILILCHANDTDVMNILTSARQVQMVSYSETK